MKKNGVFVALAFLVLLSPVGARFGQAGMVTFVFDDGLSSVYQYAFPVLDRYGFPATVGIIAGRVDSGDPDFMSVRQIRTLEKAGWEVASHSLTHKRPVDIPRRYAQERCLALRPVAGASGLFEGKYHYQVLAGLVEHGRLLRRRSSSRQVRREPGSYYFDELISELIVHPYQAASVGQNAILAVSYERELEASRKRLTALGFHITTYVTPHNYWTPEMSGLARRYYAQVADGGDDCNRRGRTDRYWLKRFTIHSSDSAADVIALVERHAIAEDGWVIFCMHGIGSDLGWEPWSMERLAALCAFLKRRDVPVVTVDAGAKRWMAPGRQAASGAARQ